MNVDNLTQLLEIGRQLSETRELNPLLESALHQALHFVGAQKGYIVLLDQDKLNFRVGLDYDGNHLTEPQEQISRTLFNQAITTGKGQITADAASSLNAPSVLALNIRSVMCAPLISRGKVLGAVYVENRLKRNFFGLDDLSLLEYFAAQAAVSIENAMLNDDLEELVKTRTAELAEANIKLQELAIRDPLTGLYNRRHFFELANLQLAHTRRYERPLSAVMMDIDHFKHINDQYGHHAGDQVLQTFAQRIQETIREVDILGRYGGEEFALLLPDTDLEEAIQLAQRLCAAIRDELMGADGKSIPVTVSLGVAAYKTGTDMSIDDLLDYADQALYHAKDTGRDRACHYESNLSAE